MANLVVGKALQFGLPKESNQVGIIRSIESKYVTGKFAEVTIVLLIPNDETIGSILEKKEVISEINRRIRAITFEDI